MRYDRARNRFLTVREFAQKSYMDLMFMMLYGVQLNLLQTAEPHDLPEGMVRLILTILKVCLVLPLGEILHER